MSLKCQQFELLLVHPSKVSYSLKALVTDPAHICSKRLISPPSLIIHLQHNKRPLLWRMTVLYTRVKRFHCPCSELMDQAHGWCCDEAVSVFSVNCHKVFLEYCWDGQAASDAVWWLWLRFNKVGGRLRSIRLMLSLRCKMYSKKKKYEQKGRRKVEAFWVWGHYTKTKYWLKVYFISWLC